MKYWKHGIFSLRQLLGRMRVALGVCIAIGMLSLAAHLTNEPLLMAPFAPSCFVLFAMPQRATEIAAGVIAAYVVAAVIALGIQETLPIAWWSVGVAVGLSVFAMEILNVIHAPALAVPVIVLLGGPERSFPFAAMGVGIVLLVAAAMILRRLPVSRVATG